MRRLLAAMSFGGRAGAAAAADVLGGVNEVSTSYDGPPPPITHAAAADSLRPDILFS